MSISSHVFMFPFQWKIPELSNKVFSEQIALGNIKYSRVSSWENVITPLSETEKQDLYNEKNYYYEFVHPVLYDTGKEGDLIKHFERVEPRRGDVFYKIGLKGKEYRLRVKSIILNLYSTGIGVLSFFLENDDYSDENDVLNINQFGRRLYPPFFADKYIRNEIPQYIEIEGLHGNPIGYREDFSRYTTEMTNTPARFIHDMIKEIATNISIKAVIDDRMYVMSCYKNDDYSKKMESDFSSFMKEEFWYKYVFVDGGSLTCQNNDMQYRLANESTYERWQKWGTVYGLSRYSMVMLTGNSCPLYLINYFLTTYVRMAELVLVQRASLLRFSGEVTNISSLKRRGDALSYRVSSLYEEYIRFVNKIHFREVSAQDQGIEMYNMLYKKANIAKEVEKLDDEIEELHNHVSLIEERKNGKVMDFLTYIASIFLPVTIISGVFGMNTGETKAIMSSWELLLIAMSLIIAILGCSFYKRKINKRR